jgi:hypothetical protein
MNRSLIRRVFAGACCLDRLFVSIVSSTQQVMCIKEGTAPVDLASLQECKVPGPFM